MWRELLKSVGKTSSKVSKIFYQKQLTRPPFIGCQKIEPLGLCQCYRSTGPVDRQRSKSDRCSLRSTDPVDRATGEESKLSVGRPARSTDNSREQSSLKRSTGPVDRSPVHTGVHVVHVRSTDPVDRPLSVLKNQNCQNQKNGIKDWSFNLIKIPEIHSKSRKIVSIKIKTVFLKICFSKTCFSITSQNTKTRYFELIKQSVYGYDPPHNQDEISSF